MGLTAVDILHYSNLSNKNYYPMMTLDILCHEVGHGVTSWKGGNMEYRAESGAMNEAYSDIIGRSAIIVNIIINN